MITSARTFVARHPRTCLWLALLLPMFILLAIKGSLVGTYASAKQQLMVRQNAQQSAVNGLSQRLEWMSNETEDQVARDLSPIALKKLSTPALSAPPPAVLDGMDLSSAVASAAPSPSPPPVRYTMMDPKTGASAILLFRDGRLLSNSFTPPPPITLDVSLWRGAEDVRVVVMTLAVMTWIALILVACVLARLRRKLAWASLAIALMCVVNTMLASEYGAMIGDPPGATTFFGGAVLIAISFALLFVTRDFRKARAVAARPAPVFHCHACNYDLTGNVSGFCPECGTQLPTRWYVAMAQQMGAIASKPGPNAELNVAEKPVREFTK